MAVDSGENSQQSSASPTTPDLKASRPLLGTRHNIPAPAQGGANSDSDKETETTNNPKKEGKKKGPQNVALYAGVRMSSPLCDGCRVVVLCLTLSDEGNDWWVGA